MSKLLFCRVRRAGAVVVGGRGEGFVCISVNVSEDVPTVSSSAFSTSSTVTVGGGGEET